MAVSNSKRSPVNQRKPAWRRIIRGVWMLAALGVLSVILLFVALSFQDLPTFDELENPRRKLASEVYDVQGELLGRYYFENRVQVDYDDINPFLVKALVSTEDERFFSHSGIDAEALGRVFVRTVLLGNRSSGGGSTITQQLAKLLYSSRNFAGMSRLERATSLVSRKLKEWITAVKLERSYTKEEIIAMYLNEFDFIYDAFGVEAAAETYFGKPQKDLKIEEAALLVGMLKNPWLFNPVRFPDTSLYRRMVVLKQLERHGYLTRTEYDSLKTLPLNLAFDRRTHLTGPAPYFRMELREQLKEILRDKVKPDGTPYNIYSDGLKIYTTIDLRMQKHLEEAATAHMTALQEKFQLRWRNLDPWKYRLETTTDYEMRIRELTLRRLIWESERYAALRSKILGPVLSKIGEVVDITLTNTDILRILSEASSPGALDELIRKEYTSREKAAQYREILNSPHIDALKKGWSQLEKATDEAFSTPVEMTVFAYTPSGEKDTIMTPLDSIKYLRSFLQVGSMAMDPLTGQIRAWVGGINFKYFQYDHVTSDRQVGSTFKPFVYATAIALQGFSPCHEVPDIPYTIHPGEGNFGLGEEWTPENASGEYSREIFTLKEGLRKSKNTVSVFLMKNLADAEPVKQVASKMGVPADKIPAVPSICLGAADLNVFDMTGAYGVFANNGMYNEPVFINYIEDANGRTIYSPRPTDRVVLEPTTNHVMVEMLKYAAGYMGMESEAGGKTGTTNDYVDGWFMGITPSLVVGTWVGGENNWIRFRTLADGQGSVMAKPIFKDFIRRLEQDPKSGYDKTMTFIKPQGELPIQLDCEQYRTNRLQGQLDSIENERFIDDPFADEIGPGAGRRDLDMEELLRRERGGQESDG
jgi:penicillin-binding protein 1A